MRQLCSELFTRAILPIHGFGPGCCTDASCGGAQYRNSIAKTLKAKLESLNHREEDGGGQCVPPDTDAAIRGAPMPILSFLFLALSSTSIVGADNVYKRMQAPGAATNDISVNGCESRRNFLFQDGLLLVYYIYAVILQMPSLAWPVFRPPQSPNRQVSWSVPFTRNQRDVNIKSTNALLPHCPLLYMCPGSRWRVAAGRGAYAWARSLLTPRSSRPLSDQGKWKTGTWRKELLRKAESAWLELSRGKKGELTCCPGYRPEHCTRPGRRPGSRRSRPSSAGRGRPTCCPCQGRTARWRGRERLGRG